MTDLHVVTKVEDRYTDIRRVEAGGSGEVGGLRIKEDHVARKYFG